MIASVFVCFFTEETDRRGRREWDMALQRKSAGREHHQPVCYSPLGEMYILLKSPMSQWVVHDDEQVNVRDKKTLDKRKRNVFNFALRAMKESFCS